MALLKREAILGATDRKFVEVEVPEWGGTVRLGEMSGAARDSYEMENLELANQANGDRNIRAALVARCVVDEGGRAVFTKADVEALGQKSSKALRRLFTLCVDLNAIGKEAADTAAKNSEGGAPEGERSA